MSSEFYRVFEDRFRGSRELIKSRLRVYLPFVAAVKSLYPQAGAIDLGCGRGEWLELLLEEGIEARGIDLDECMLAPCRELGLAVEQGEAVSFLKRNPDNSVGVISGFHIAEHLAFSDLQALVFEAKRVLLPGGLLILETPNPENLLVATSSFYVDPTHVRPLPPQLLMFLVEFYGFSRSKLLRLQESAALLEGESVSLIDVLVGVSPDYAVVAQTTTDAEKMAAFDAVFAGEYGITLEALARRFSDRLQILFEDINLIRITARQEAEAALWAKEAQLQQAEAALWAKEAQLQQAEAALWAKEAQLRQAEVTLRQQEKGQINFRSRCRRYIGQFLQSVSGRRPKDPEHD